MTVLNPEKGPAMKKILIRMALLPSLTGCSSAVVRQRQTRGR